LEIEKSLSSEWNPGTGIYQFILVDPQEGHGDFTIAGNQFPLIDRNFLATSPVEACLHRQEETLILHAHAARSNPGNKCLFNSLMVMSFNLFWKAQGGFPKFVKPFLARPWS
jgi:hypothetical protein